eukprot:16449999-Heterocapsa_arctica.AAC.4
MILLGGCARRCVIPRYRSSCGPWSWMPFRHSFLSPKRGEGPSLPLPGGFLQPSPWPLRNPPTIATPSPAGWLPCAGDSSVGPRHPSASLGPGPKVPLSWSDRPFPPLLPPCERPNARASSIAPLLPSLIGR